MADVGGSSGIGGPLSAVAVFVAGGLVIYGIETGIFGDRPSKDNDTAVMEAVEEAEPTYPAEAWGTWRPNPVAGFDDEVTEESFFVEAPEVVELAWGWSQSRAEPIPTVCIEYGVDHRNAQSSDINITEVRDSYALAKAMNVSSSVSVKGVGYQVSGKASFAKNTNVSSSSVTYLVNAEVLNSAQYVAPPDNGPEDNTSVGAVRLTDEARALALRDIERFQVTCGEGFVSATISGARAYLLAETQTSSRSERQSVRASVKGEGWGVKVDAAAGLDTNETTENLTRNITFYQQGGAVGAGGDEQDSLPKDAMEAVKRIQELPVAAATAGKVFELQITPYQVLENFPRGEDILAAEVDQDEIAADWGAYATLYDDLKEVLENPENYAVPMRVCDAEGCEIEFVDLVADDKVNVEATAVVEELQDMTLRAMNEIEIAADICLMLEEDCDYDGSLVRSPYAVRASMPMLVREERTVTTEDQDGNETESIESFELTDLTTEDHLIQHLREPSLGRCVFGANTSGCITNAEVRQWAARTGLSNIVSDRHEALAAEILTCEGVSAKDVHTGDADDPDASTLWFPVSAKLGPDGSVGCTKAILQRPTEENASGSGETQPSEPENNSVPQ